MADQREVQQSTSRYQNYQRRQQAPVYFHRMQEYYADQENMRAMRMAENQMAAANNWRAQQWAQGQQQMAYGGGYWDGRYGVGGPPQDYAFNGNQFMYNSSFGPVPSQPQPQPPSIYGTQPGYTSPPQPGYTTYYPAMGGYMAPMAPSMVSDGQGGKAQPMGYNDMDVSPPMIPGVPGYMASDDMLPAKQPSSYNYTLEASTTSVPSYQPHSITQSGFGYTPMSFANGVPDGNWTGYASDSLHVAGAMTGGAANQSDEARSNPVPYRDAAGSRNSATF